VVLNGLINAAREATKTHKSNVETFQSGEYGYLGTVDPDRVVFYRRAVKRHTAASEFDVSTIAELPRVDVLLVYQDAPGDLIKAAVDLGARGLVVAAAGAGATSGTQSDGLGYAIGKGVTVVVTTRAGSGRISGTRRFGAAFVGGEDLAPIKARILLMLALATAKTPADIQRMFLEY
jgi:L-asparaginase